METDAPPLLLGGAGMRPVDGLAARVGSEEGLIGHPDVYAAGDMREENWNATPGKWKDQSLGRGKLFHSTSMSRNQYLKTKVVPDPEFPGRFYLDTCIATGQIGGGEMKIALGIVGDMSDPLRPVLESSIIKEAYSRIEVYLDPETFWSTNYAFKFSPVGMDLRFGLWDDRGGWNSKGGSVYVFGSGQTSSDGRRSLDAKYNQWLYKGHSIRGHLLGWPHRTATAYPNAVGLGIAPSHLGPYDTFWDGGLYGTEQNLKLFMTNDDTGLPSRRHVIPKGRWVTLESYTRINSVVGPFDADGNGTAVNDGMFRIHMDGVPCGERNNIAWTRHPHMGVRATWTMQYHGGTTPTDHDIRIMYRNPVVAKRYIGLAVKPVLA
jgi:hypothetical protein